GADATAATERAQHYGIAADRLDVAGRIAPSQLFAQDGRGRPQRLRVAGGRGQAAQQTVLRGQHRDHRGAHERRKHERNETLDECHALMHAQSGRHAPKSGASTVRHTGHHVPRTGGSDGRDASSRMVSGDDPTTASTRIRRPVVSTSAVQVYVATGSDRVPADGADARSSESSSIPAWSVATSRRCACTATRAACAVSPAADRKSTRLNSSHVKISYAVFCLK